MICTTGRFLAQEIVFTLNESFAIATMNGTTSVGMKLDSLASVLVGLSSVIIRGDYNEWSNGAAARSTQKTGLSRIYRQTERGCRERRRQKRLK